MKQLKEHKSFRNQCIVLTIILFVLGGFLLIPFEFLAKDAPQGGYNLMGFGFVMGLLAIYNIFTYKQNKKDYENRSKNL